MPIILFTVAVDVETGKFNWVGHVPPAEALKILQQVILTKPDNKEDSKDEPQRHG